MRTTATKRRAITLVMAAGLLSGCAGGDGGQGSATPSPTPSDNGISTLAPDEVLRRATAALKSARSYRIKGGMDADGKRMDLDFRVAGANLGGRLSMEGASIELLSVDGRQYIRPDEKFWERIGGPGAAEKVAKVIGDKWAELPESEKDFADLFGIANVEELLEPSGTLARGPIKDFDGVKALGLVDQRGNTLYVAMTGEPYPIRMEGSTTKEGQLTLSEFGAIFDNLIAPPETEVVDFEKLRGN
jgi:hypothetical protein